jgi:hypothetical protein
MHLLSNPDIPVEVVLENNSREEVLLYGTAHSVDVCSPVLFQRFASCFLIPTAKRRVADGLNICKWNLACYSLRYRTYLIIRQAINPVNLQLAQRRSENHGIFVVRIVR